MSRAQSKRLAPQEDVFAHHPIAQLLGIRLQSITRSRVRAELPVMAQHMNRGGRVAGGVIMTFADLLGARGTVANLPPGARTTTLESKTNFFAAGEAPLLEAVSIPLHIGRTTMVWQTTVRNADGRTVAVVTQTQMVLMPRVEKPVASSAEAEPAVRRGARASGRAERSAAARTDSKTSIRPDAESGIRPDAKSGVRPDAKSGVRPDAKSGVRPDAESGVRRVAKRGAARGGTRRVNGSRVRIQRP